MAKKKTITGLVNEAAKELQRIVRMKAALAGDGENIQCVTCHKWDHWKNMQGGHYIKRQHKNWTLDETNIHPQCVRCNHFLDGNEGRYTLYMLDMYGREYVDHMQATAGSTKKYFRVELEEIIQDLKEQAKGLEAQL